MSRESLCLSCVFSSHNISVTFDANLDLTSDRRERETDDLHDGNYDFDVGPLTRPFNPQIEGRRRRLTY